MTNTKMPKLEVPESSTRLSTLENLRNVKFELDIETRLDNLETSLDNLEKFISLK